MLLSHWASLERTDRKPSLKPLEDTANTQPTARCLRRSKMVEKLDIRQLWYTARMFLQLLLIVPATSRRLTGKTDFR